MNKFENTGSKDTRSGFGSGLLELGRSNPNVVALCADLTGSLKMDGFMRENPERFFQVGVAEANMIGIAAGLTIGGKIPYTGTFANFSTGRVYDQIRQSVAYSNKNVKICASHSGITLGEDGATHQILEDIGLMKMLPGMVVINPCDYNQTKAATIAISKHYGPVYLRFGRPSVPNFTDPNLKFEIGKGIILNQGTDVTIIATGHLVWDALNAAEYLEEKGIYAEVINIHTIKPIDKNILETEHQINQQSISFEEKVALYIKTYYPYCKCIIQNGSWFNLIESDKPRVILIQDNLRKMKRVHPIQENNFKNAEHVVVNSDEVASFYHQRKTIQISVGVDDILFNLKKTDELKKKYFQNINTKIDEKYKFMKLNDFFF